MEARTNWNDGRLDHLSEQVDSLRDKVDSLRDHMDQRFDSLQNAMIITLAGILAALGSALLATQL
jgi:hypothetical protein